MSRYGMVIDTRKCVGCMSCAVSCKMENSVPFGVFRSWVEQKDKGSFPEVRRYFLPRLCNHCEHPPCVPVCPVGATYKREDGLVLIDEERCIGCGYCVVACPYYARYLHPVRNVAGKCTFCQHRVDKGAEPACVHNCMGKARKFGDLDNPNSEVSRLIGNNPSGVLKPELGTEPQVYYIGDDLGQHQVKKGA